jgi:hypothetical protein
LRVSLEKGNSDRRSSIRAVAAWLAAVLTASVLAVPPAHAGQPERFDGTVSSTRSTGLAGAFSPLADDISAIFVNPAGLMNTGGIAVYADYLETGGGAGPREGKFAAGFEMWDLVFAAGGSQKSYDDGTTEGQFSAGFAINLLTGSAGSFLSAGGALRAGRVAFDLPEPCVPCGTPAGRYSYNALTADLGLMIRPLPFISLSLSTENISETGFGSGEYHIPWDRTVRYGAAWLHEDRFTISWEHRSTGGRETDHFGFGLRTAIPLELMAGMTSERVYGGARWDGGRWRASAVFGQEAESVITAGASIEVFFNRPARIYQ